DADDVWLPDKLEKQLAAMRSEPEAGLCFTDRMVIDSDANVVPTPRFAQPDGVSIFTDPRQMDQETVLRTILSTCITTSTVLMRRSTLAVSGMFDPLLFFSEDYDMWQKIAMQYKVMSIGERMTLYRLHAGNAMGNYELAVKHDWEMYQKHSSRA